MVAPKPPKHFCIDEFVYKEYKGEDEYYSEPIYDEPITINNCRIDRGAEYTSNSNGRQLLYKAVIFCYEDITAPLLDFKPQSIVVFDDVEHVVTKVIPIYQPYEKQLYSYELEVI